MTNPFPNLSLTPAAAASVKTWEAQAAPCRDRIVALPPMTTVAENLRARASADQCMRTLLPKLAMQALSSDEQQAARTKVYSQIFELDRGNTNYLKSVLPSDGWFRASRDGKQTAHDAWLIVQHSPDKEFQRTVAERMVPLAEAGEVDARDFAMLFDRTEIFAGRLQYYGSQYRCENGRWAPEPSRDPTGVEARRAKLGLGSMADNTARLNAGGGC